MPGYYEEIDLLKKRVSELEPLKQQVADIAAIVLKLTAATPKKLIEQPKPKEKKVKEDG